MGYRDIKAPSFMTTIKIMYPLSYMMSMALCLQLAYAQQTHPTAIDLSGVVGIHQGTLTYLDYSSDKTVTLELVGLGVVKGDKLILTHTFYEWGRVIEQKYTYRISDGSFDLGPKATIVSQEVDEETGAFKVVIDKPGKDGNDKQDCTFRMTFAYDGKVFSIKKEVQFEGDATFFQRNLYRLTIIGQS